MKIRIDHKGILGIERGCVIKEQICPFDGLSRCGDFCPQFGEPESIMTGGEFPDEPRPTGESRLAICQGRILFGEIIDERKEPGK